MADLYDQRGVSSSKGEVHAAIKYHDPGLFPGAFCKIIPDYLTGDPEYCLAMHADGAGTKSVAAYIAWREGFSIKDVWECIDQDSLMMNLDDLGCIGAMGAFIINQTVSRNKFLIPGSVIAAVISGCQSLCDILSLMGFQTVMSGGETEDVPDLTRTITINNSVVCRMKRSDVIDASRMRPGDIIIGYSSTGQSAWEKEPNSGLGSNGFTNLRHDILSPRYGILYPETFCPEMKKDLVYRGRYFLNDDIAGSSVYKAVLSPTRTYLPVIRLLLEKIPREHIHGLIHCSGGGQTKILKFGQPGNLYVKDNPFPVSPLFEKIKEASGVDWRQMYQTFNMGHRLEVVVPKEFQDICLSIGAECSIEARKVGEVKTQEKDLRKLFILAPNGELINYTEGE